MIRALEDILANVNHAEDTVTVSYLQVQINSLVMFQYYELARFLFLNVPIIEPKHKF